MNATATLIDLKLEKRVYDALWQHLHNAGNLMNVKKIVRALRSENALPPLLQAMSSKSLVKVAQRLFQASVFQSKKTADARFGALREIESTSAPPSAAALLEASQSSPRLSELTVAAPEPEPALESDEESGSVGETTASEMEVPTGSQNLPTSSDASEQNYPDNPLTISYTVQHRVLSEMQRILEEACFSFAQRRQLDILETMSWDCPEAIELNIFMRKTGLSSVRFDEDGTARCALSSMSRLIASVSRIRHAAVHRERVTEFALENMLCDSQDLLSLLGDENAIRIMADLQGKIEQGLTELGEQERQVDSHVELDMGKIRTQRAKLDEWERSITLAAEEQKREMRHRAGAGISAALVSSRTNRPAAENKNHSLLFSVPTTCWDLVVRIWAAALLSLGYLHARKVSVIQD